LPEAGRVFRVERRVRDQPTKAGEIFVGQHTRHLVGEEPRGNHHIEALLMMEREGIAEAVECFSADSPPAGLEPAQRAVVDPGELRGLLLAKATLGAQAEKQWSKTLWVSHGSLR
jgi:hypothetical protein